VKYPDIKLVLVSNTNETHFDFIKREYKVLESLDHCVVSHESGSIKPHPGIYSDALKAAGVISKEAFYTDDRQDLIDAARVMGMRAHLFTDHEKFLKDLAKCGVEV
jgi:HAD superfamily hydrolase (TIGR01509 family)